MRADSLIFVATSGHDALRGETAEVGGQTVYRIEAAESTTMAPAGRPRSFDRDIALSRAMEVFWAKGYEGAQLTDLTEAMGIKPPSFYAAFGSKEEAFREAVDLYTATVGSAPIKALHETHSVRQAIAAMLQASINVTLSCQPGGCFLILGLVNCLSENESARKYLLEVREGTLNHIRRRLVRGIAEGDLPGSANVEALARFYNGILQAISFQARDGVSRKDLEALIAPSLAALG